MVQSREERHCTWWYLMIKRQCAWKYKVVRRGTVPDGTHIWCTKQLAGSFQSLGMLFVSYILPEESDSQCHTNSTFQYTMNGSLLGSQKKSCQSVWPPACGSNPKQSSSGSHPRRPSSGSNSRHHSCGSDPKHLSSGAKPKHPVNLQVIFERRKPIR